MVAIMGRRTKKDENHCFKANGLPCGKWNFIYKWWIFEKKLILASELMSKFGTVIKVPLVLKLQTKERF